MRIMRKKLDDKVRRALAVVTRTWVLDDPGLAEDVFVLLRQRGAGLPTDERISALASAEATKHGVSPIISSALMRRRAFMLKELAELTYFRSLCIEMGGSPIDAVDRLFGQIRQYGRKARSAQCIGCPYRGSCKLGDIYADTVQDIRRIAVAEVDKLAHPKCPHLDDLSANADMLGFTKLLSNVEDSPDALAQLIKDMVNRKVPGIINRLEQAIEQVDEATEDYTNDMDSEIDPDIESDFDVFYDESDTGGNAGGIGSCGGFTGSNLNLTEVFLDKITKEQLALFDIGRVLDSLLKQPGTDKYTPTEELGKRTNTENIESVSELGQADAAEFAHDSDLVLRKAVKGELTKDEHLTQQAKKHLLYVLIDNSGSMGAQVGGANAIGAATRINFASIFAAALARKIGREKGMMFFRLFADNVGRMHSARTLGEFDDMQKILARCDANGGGTNIARALTSAWADINTARDEVAKSEVLIITDCEDSLDYDSLAALKRDLKLHILDVSGHKRGSAGKTLRMLSERYFKLDPSQPDLSKMVLDLATPNGSKKATK